MFRARFGTVFGTVVGARRSGAARPRRAVTGRALVLGTVVVLLLIVLAAPMSRYFASRQAVGAQAAQLQHDQQQLRQVRQELARWADPGYIQRQARAQLQFAMPGDSVYVVIDHGRRNDIQRTVDHSVSTPVTGSWNTRLWHSVQHADASG